MKNYFSNNHIPFSKLNINTSSFSKRNLNRCSKYLFLFSLMVFVSSCSSDFDGISPKEYVEQNNLNATELEGGMYILIDEVGDAQRATADQVVLVDYRGILANTGETVLEGENFTGVFSTLLLGWQTGLKEIGVGGKCTLILPPDLAFGDQVIEGIPQKSTVVFEVTLKGIFSATTVEGYIERNNLSTTVLENGVQIVIIEPGNNKKPTANTEVRVNYKGKLTNELVFDQGEDVSFNLSDLIEGWGIGLQEIGEGGKCILIIPSESGYGITGAGNGVIPPNSPLVFEIDLIEVGSAADKYVEENNLSTQLLAGGVHIIVTDIGDEEKKPNINSVVTVTYEGRLTDGTVFDSGDNVPFVLSGVIDGWLTGLQEIGVGGTCTLIIPASAGYGSQANGIIPANSVLIFDIEIISVS
ncbi:MAG: FKBP-type peptidyl-prolyl cis-trans isomerase [Halioglobus sp.]|jgi:FKBP-type peptidyl-prolyl cis-trans isomerase